MRVLEGLERRIEAIVRGWTERLVGRPTDPNLIEIRHAVLDEVEAAVEPAGRGERLFPYDRLVLRIASPEPRRRTLLEMTLRDRRFLDELRARVRRAGAEPPAALTLVVEGLPEPAEDWGDPRYALELGFSEARTAASGPDGPPAAHLRVTRGRASRLSYDLRRGRINIGRLADVLDDDERLVRRNDVAFDDDGDEVNLTVSRAHAHLSHEPETGSWRVVDDGSAHGTRVFREGRSIEVARGSRGVRLQPGDEVYCGQACLKFE